MQRLICHEQPFTAYNSIFPNDTGAASVEVGQTFQQNELQNDDLAGDLPHRVRY